MASCRQIILAICLASLLALSSAQYWDFAGGPQASNLVAGDGPANTRDARGNTGPITFPPSSPGSETSGVVVGASGFGFVPGQPRLARAGPYPGLY